MKKLLCIFLFLTLSIVGFAQHQFTTYVTASGTNSYAVTISVPTIANYSTKEVHLRFANANNAASTLNVTPIGGSPLGAIPIRMWDGDSWEVLTGGEIKTTVNYYAVYTGSYFELYPLIGSGGGGSGTGSVNDSLRVKTVTGTTYTPIQADHAYLIYLTNAGTVTITLDDAITTNTSLSFRKDDGAGNVIFISDGTSVLTSRLTYDTDTLKTKYATCTWVKRNSTEFSGIGMFGDASSGGGGGSPQNLQSVLDEGGTASTANDVTIVKNTAGNEVIFGMEVSSNVAQFNANAAADQGSANITAQTTTTGSANVGVAVVDGGTHQAQMIALNNSANGSRVTVNQTDVTLNTNNTNRLKIDTDGSWDMAGTTPGTSGQFLKTNGSGSAPAWSDVSVAVGNITGLGTGVGTWLASATSTNLAAAITDETGSGPLAFSTSPALTGTPTAPTASPGTNNTQLATTAYVDAAVTAGSIPDGDKGDITTSSSGTVWTIDNAVISYAKIQNLDALSVLGRSANSSGVSASIAAGTDNQVLRRSGTSIGFGAVNLASSDAVTGVLPVANGGSGSSAGAWPLNGTGTLTANVTIAGAFDVGFSDAAAQMGIGMAPGSIDASSRLDVASMSGGNAQRWSDASNNVMWIMTSGSRFGNTANNYFAPINTAGTESRTGVGMKLQMNSGFLDVQNGGANLNNIYVQRIGGAMTASQNSGVGGSLNLNTNIVNTSASNFTGNEFNLINYTGTVNVANGSTTVRVLYWNPTITSSAAGTFHGIVLPMAAMNSGFGVSTPTAKIHLGAGTTSANTGPLKFTEGSNPTSAEDGILNYVSNNLTFTETSTVYVIPKQLTGSGTIDFTSVSANGELTSNITVTGAADGDKVVLGWTNAAESAGIIYTAHVSATNTVTVKASNITLSPIDPGSGTFKVSVIKD